MKGRNDRSHVVRVAALLAAFAAAGCISNAEVLHAEMHAAIPATRTPGNVFEYN